MVFHTQNHTSTSFLFTNVFLTCKLRNWSLERLGNPQGKCWLQYLQISYFPHKRIRVSDSICYVHPFLGPSRPFLSPKEPFLGVPLPGSPSPLMSQVLVLLEMLPRPLHSASFQSLESAFHFQKLTCSFRLSLYVGLHLPHFWVYSTENDVRLRVSRHPIFADERVGYTYTEFCHEYSVLIVLPQPPSDHLPPKPPDTSVSFSLKRKTYKCQCRGTRFLESGLPGADASRDRGQAPALQNPWIWIPPFFPFPTSKHVANLLAR